MRSQPPPLVSADSNSSNISADKQHAACGSSGTHTAPLCTHAGVDFRVKYLTINGKRVKLAVW